MKLLNPLTWTLLITPAARSRASGAAGSLPTNKPIVPDPRAVMLGQLIAAHAGQLLGIPSTRRASLLDGLPLMATVDPDLNAAVRYELKNVLGALDQAVKTYNLVEDANTQAFRQALR